MGVERAVYEVNPCAHVSKLIWDLSKEIVHCGAYGRFYESEYLLAYMRSLICSPDLNPDSLIFLLC